MDKRGEGGAAARVDADSHKPLAQATAFYQRGEFLKAAEAYSRCLDELPANRNYDHRIGILYNRATCHLKLKNYEKLLADCDAVLDLDPNNIKIYSRKVKALCSLGRFIEAHSIAHRWKQVAPENPQALKEYGRLDRIVTALQEQEDDGLEDSLDEPGFSLMLSDGAPAASGLVCAGGEGAAEVNGTAAEHDHGEQGAGAHGGATGEGERVEASHTCSCCDITFNTRQELRVHCTGELHRKKVMAEEERDWKHRPPPRGLTSREYSKCPRYFGEGTCRFGSRCSQAHSEEELAEWKERFEQKKERLQLAKEGDSRSNNYAEQLMKTWMNAENPESVMTESLEGVNVHVGSDLSVTVTTKRCTHNWTFTVTSKICLRRVVLLDDATRRHFHIASITVGPKKTQKTQKIQDQCQEWTNPAFSTNKPNADKVYRIKVAFKTDIYGTLRQSLILDFGSEPVLVRQLCVDSKTVSDLDVTSLDLKLDESGRWDLSTKTIISFEPSPHTKEAREEALLAHYPPPMEGRFTVSAALLEPSISPPIYKARMHDLLYIEEMAQFSSISKFNVKTTVQIVDRFMLMPSTVTVAKFAQGGELFAQMRLVSDISEDTAQGRLILQNVSHVYVAPYDSQLEECEGAEAPEPEKVYEAFVEEKGKNFIFIRLSANCVQELKLKKDQEFSAQVQFQLNRLPLSEMHDAVDRLPDVHFVFPNLSIMDQIPWNPLRQWSDKLDTRLNAKQKEAIVAITTDTKHRLPPILIVGPYGTGKTFTLAQATKQILKQEGTRVLICTHSNSAADLYIKDYLHPYVTEDHPEARPLRIYYRQRWINTVNPVVFEYCLVINRGTPQVQFFNPTKEDVEAHRVIVCTLSTARYLYDLGLEDDCFSHILLDESAQAMECETIMPLALAGPMTRVVLAGDHMQLSPEVHSDFARDRNLHVSLLERMYDLYPNVNPCKILLCENYRSHKAVLDYTSELFYDNKLVASGSQPRHELFYPLTFFTARGEDLQHQNSTTFYNNSEVYEVVERVSELAKMWPKCWGPIDENGIGVVSPYSDQVIRIRAELRKRKLYNISVERVLNVQGKQFRAIFLSTVRTRHTCSTDGSLEDFIDYGFLSNVKLLNTAITRAQSLVAVVGDPISLCTIGKCRKLWERFIEICNKNNSLHGITWNVLRSQLDGVELKKTYVLNPLAPEFVPNRLRHACYSAPEPVGFGKYGYTFTSQSGRPNWVRAHGSYLPPQPHMGMYYPQPLMQMQFIPPYASPHVPRHIPWSPRAPNGHSLTTAAATLTGSPIKLPVSSSAPASTHKPTVTASFSVNNPSATSPTTSGVRSGTSGSSPTGKVSGVKEHREPQMSPSAVAAAAAMSNGSVMAPQPQANFLGTAPRMTYHHPHPQQAGPRFPFFPSAHLVPQVYAMSPQYMMAPQQQQQHRPRLIGGAVGPMGAHNLLGAPIAPHQHPIPPMGLHQYTPTSGTLASPVTSSVNSSVSPSPISPLQNWPGLPSASPSPSSTQERTTPTITKAGTSQNSVQLLPNVCNASIEVKPEANSTSPPQAGTSHPQTSAETPAAGNGFSMPFNIDRNLLMQNGFLQRELSNYIRQTQGALAAQNFLCSVDPHYKPTKFKMNMVCGINKTSKDVPTGHPEHDPRPAHLATLQNETRHRHETVSVKMTEAASGQDQHEDAGRLAPAGCGSGLNSDPSIIASRVSSEYATTRAPGYTSMLGFGQPAGLSYSNPQRRAKEEWALPVHPNMHLAFGAAQPLQDPMSNGAPNWEQMHNGVGHPMSQNHAIHKRKPGIAGSGRVIPPQNRVVPQRQQSNGSSSSGAESHSEELLSDRELPSAVDHMVRYIEDSLEEKHSESDLGNIHIGHNPLKLSLSAPGGSTSRPANAEIHAPLYMRRGSNTGATPTGRNLSYAGALRSQPPLQALQSEDPTTTTENPLDLLKNLNIKASPGTQAFYQYFS